MTYRKSFLKFILFLLTVSFIPLYSAQKLRVGLYENSPKIFTDKDGKPAGFWVDITNYIADKEDWEIEWVKGSWNECLERLERNEIDIMPDVGWNIDRSEKYNFNNETVLLSWSSVFVRQGFNFQSVNDLEGKKIGVLKNSVNYTGPDGIRSLLERFEITCQFVEMDSYPEIFRAVESSTIDAGVTNKHFGDMYANDRIIKTSFDFLPSRLKFAMSKNRPSSSDILSAIDIRIRDIKSDQESFYYNSISRWFANQSGSGGKIPVWVWWVIGILAVSASGLYIFNFILSGMVKLKTSELEKANAEMEDKIRTRTAELRDANEKLKELDHLKSMFIASMSHELRTPLNSIIGFTGLILQGMSGKIDDAVKEDLEIVYNSSGHLLNLINDVIDISKIEADRFEVYFEEADIYDLISNAVKNISKEAERKNIAIINNSQEDLIARTDKRRLYQCVLNLLSNAVKYSEKGTVTINTQLENKLLSIIVSDTGIGIKQEDLPKLFTSFLRLDSKLKENTLGTGLGLYLTKKIMNRVFRGDVNAKSEQGKGSVFTLTIPLFKEGE